MRSPEHDFRKSLEETVVSDSMDGKVDSEHVVSPKVIN